MKQLSLLTASIGAFVLFGPGSAFAITPQYCDTQVQDCQCPSNLANAGLDACGETSAGNLIDARDASALSNYVSATLDSSGEFYDVVIDAESMPGGGVLLIDANWGEWDDLTELRDYFRVLLDDAQLELPQDCSSGDCEILLMPRMRITQRGVTHRLVDGTGIWAPANSYNLIIDAITNADGAIVIGTHGPFTLFATDECPGTDAASLDTQTDANLSGVQCSDSHSDYLPFGDPHCGSYKEPCGVVNRTAQTSLETASTERFGTTLRCEKDGTGYACDLVNGLIVNERVEADELDLQTRYYNSQIYIGGHIVQEYDVMEILSAETRANGTCAFGKAKEGLSEITLKTRDGAYDATETLCVF